MSASRQRLIDGLHAKIERNNTPYGRVVGMLQGERHAAKLQAKKASGRGDREKLAFWQARWNYLNTLVNMAEFIGKERI